MRRYQVISADGHLEAHAELWAGRVAAKYQDLAPKYVVLDNGVEAWKMGEFINPVSIDTTYSGLPYDQATSKNSGYHNPDGSYRPGLGGPAQRLREQDEDGVDAEVLYPPVFGPNFIRKMLDKDKDAYLAIVQGYNSWLAEDFCSMAPDRLIGMAIVPDSGVDDAIAEMERCRNMGLLGVCLNMWPNGSLDPSPDDDRFWAASLDLGMKISPHQNFGRPGTGVRPDGPDVSWMGARSRVVGRPTYSIGQAVGHGVFDRFPDLKFYFAEADAGWLSYHMSTTDDWYLRWYHERGVRLPKMPSQYYRDNCRFSFLWDPTAVQLRYNIGLDLIMWASDLPHSTGSYPHSREVIAAQFEGVPENEKRQLLVGNVCTFFDLDPEKELTPTP